jgi:hypothetical protein
MQAKGAKDQAANHAACTPISSQRAIFFGFGRFSSCPTDTSCQLICYVLNAIVLFAIL